MLVLDTRLVKKPPELGNIDYTSDNKFDKSDNVSHEQYAQECHSDDEEMLKSVTEMPIGSSLSGQKRVRDPRQ
jgi:hypothetical protein|tara:strand:- start:9742 stop:9960 length:219 start_codon:yes stop_codon:yes gene_type:complete